MIFIFVNAGDMLQKTSLGGTQWKPKSGLTAFGGLVTEQIVDLHFQL
jgi:hypothetical protein